jgi:RNA polymerase sigma-70 factor, ECF subfamily
VAAAGPVAREAAGRGLGDLFETHHQRLYRLARRMVASSDEARDLVQDTFLRAARSPRAVPRAMPAEEAWLVRVLVNLCRDRWRRRGVERRFHERHRASMTGQRAHRASTSEDALIAQTLIWRALRALPPRRRAVIVMHELDGLGVGDVARLLGIAAVTVRWHLSQGRRELARAIGEEHNP